MALLCRTKTCVSKGTVEGPAKLVGLINNDLRRTTPFTSTEDITHFGRAFAVVQTTREVGNIRLRLEVEGFDAPVYVDMSSAAKVLKK